MTWESRLMIIRGESIHRNYSMMVIEHTHSLFSILRHDHHSFLEQNPMQYYKNIP